MMGRQSRSSRHVLLLFLDGLGVGGSEGSDNPLAESRWRVLSRLQMDDGAITQDRTSGSEAWPITATLGVPGLPQSATGQTALLTGVNAAARLNRHLTGFPNAKLRDVIARESIFLQLARRGLVGNFANAFTPEFFHCLRRRRLSVTTWSTLAAGRPLATLQDLMAGRAVYQEFTNLFLQLQGYDVPRQSPSDAATALAGLAEQQPFLLYEYFLTDIAGHDGGGPFVQAIIELLDEFLDVLIRRVDLSRVTVILTSDHGNIEDLSVTTHTRNPVPFIVWGPGAAAFRSRVRSIMDVTPAIVEYLGG
ncbi:MAG: hypothetical protein JXQ27_09905 [Acidobacteria bacterium]|nr:hypothetical protein [Acidobacteriota bacterium]